MVWSKSFFFCKVASFRDHVQLTIVNRMGFILFRWRPNRDLWLLTSSSFSVWLIVVSMEKLRLILYSYLTGIYLWFRVNCSLVHLPNSSNDLLHQLASIVIRGWRSSVNFYKHLVICNYWVNWNHTWPKSSYGYRLSRLWTNMTGMHMAKNRNIWVKCKFVFYTWKLT